MDDEVRANRAHFYQLEKPIETTQSILSFISIHLALDTRTKAHFPQIVLAQRTVTFVVIDTARVLYASVVEVERSRRIVRDPSTPF